MGFPIRTSFIEDHFSTHIKSRGSTHKHKNYGFDIRNSIPYPVTFRSRPSHPVTETQFSYNEKDDIDLYFFNIGA